MDRACEVCGIRATGVHFGVFSCRACAAFFRRTTLLKLKYKCTKRNDCPIGKDMRSSCKSCRMDKCTALGMNITKASRSSDSASSDLGSSSSSPGSSDSIPSIFLDPSMLASSIVMGIDNMVKEDGEEAPRASAIVRNIQFKASNFPNIQIDKMKACIEDIFVKKLLDTRLPFQVKKTVMEQAITAFDEYRKNVPKSSRDKLYLPTFDCDKAAVYIFNEITGIAKFAMTIDPFIDLPFDQKWILYRGFWGRMTAIERFYDGFVTFGDEVKDLVVLCDGSTYNCELFLAGLSSMAIDESLDAFSFFQALYHLMRETFAGPLIKLRPTYFEIVFCIIYSMWDVKHLSGVTTDTVRVAETIRTQVTDELYSYYAFEQRMTNFASRLSSLVNAISGLTASERQRQEDRILSNTFQVFKKDIFLTELSPHINMFG